MKRLFPILTVAVGLATTAMANETSSTWRTRAENAQQTASEYASVAGERISGAMQGAKEYASTAATRFNDATRGTREAVSGAATRAGEFVSARTSRVRGQLSGAALTARCQAVNSSTCANPDTFASILNMGCKGGSIQNCAKKFCERNCAAASVEYCPNRDNAELTALCLKGCTEHFFGREDLHKKLFTCLQDPRVEYTEALKRANEAKSKAETLRANQPTVVRFTKAYEKAAGALQEYKAAKAEVDALARELRRLGVPTSSIEGVDLSSLPLLSVE